MLERRHGVDLGAIVFGGLLLFVGAWYTLRNILGVDLGDLDLAQLWPLLVIALGVSVIVKTMTGDRGSTRT